MVFRTIGVTGSSSAAALALSVSKPAISKSLSLLEQVCLPSQHLPMQSAQQLCLQIAWRPLPSAHANMVSLAIHSETLRLQMMQSLILDLQAFGGPLTVRRNGLPSNGASSAGHTWLTEAGQALLPLCNNILAVAGETIRAISDLRAAHTGRVMLAASQTVGTYVMPRLLAAFRLRNPGVRRKKMHVLPLPLCPIPEESACRQRTQGRDVHTALREFMAAGVSETQSHRMRAWCLTAHLNARIVCQGSTAGSSHEAMSAVLQHVTLQFAVHLMMETVRCDISHKANQ